MEDGILQTGKVAAQLFLLLSGLVIKPALADEYLSNTSQIAVKPSQHVLTVTPPEDLSSPTKSDAEIELEEIWNGVSSSFDFPYEEWQSRTFLQGLSGNIGYHHPLATTESANLPAGATNGPSNNNTTATLSLKYTIAGAWFISGTAYYYWDSEQQQAWNPDFTYVFGYSDWRPYTFSLVYSNYGGNRFSPEEGGRVTEFNQGTWALGWKFPVTGIVKDWISFTEQGAIGCQVDFNHTPEYFDLASISYKKNHQTLSLGCKYSIFGNWYVNATAFYYFDRAQQQPWNPDYTYGFGYFDWRPGTVTLQYNNYSGNHWHPSERGEDTGRFKDGSITLAYGFSF